VGFFDSKSTSTQVTNEYLSDSRATGIDGGSQVATGGGSAVYREIIPVEPLDSVLGAILSAQGQALDTVRAQTQASGEALSKAFEQRKIETDTVQSTLTQITPLIIGVLVVVALVAWRD